MKNIVIVEDEKSAADVLTSYLDRYTKEKGVAFQSVWFENPIAFLTNYKPKYDLVFLDIELPDMNGMDVAHKLRELDDSVALIFVTNMAQFAIKGYEVNAFDFIVKPVSYFDFALKLQRVLERIKSIDGQKISVSVDDAVKCVYVEDIYYVEVIKHKVIYHTAQGNLESYGALKNIEPMLLDADFVRCNNCYLVNLRYVTAVKGFTTIVAGDLLQVSHPKRKQFVQALNNYLGGNL